MSYYNTNKLEGEALETANKKEEWRDVIGYEGIYMISSLGRIASIRKGSFNKIEDCVMKPYKEPNRYISVVLNRKGNVKSKYIHQLVAESFLGHKSKKGGLVVDHIDSNKFNNNLLNLRLLTHRDNSSKEISSKTDRSSTLMGVHRHKDRWMSRIYINGKRLYLGNFKSEVKASTAYLVKLADNLKPQMDLFKDNSNDKATR